MDIKRLRDAWAEQTVKRNAYKFADEEVTLNSFAELVKDTFEALRFVKNQYFYNASYPEDPYLFFEYLDLIAELSRYSTYDYDGDESEDYKFTVTCLVAQALVNYVIYPESATRENGVLKLCDGEDSNAGELVICRAEYPYFSEKIYDKAYHYNVYKADFSEVLDLAKEILLP